MNARIAVVVPLAFLPALKGGLEITTWNNIAIWRAAGAEVTVFCRRFVDGSDIPAKIARRILGPYAARRQYEGVPVVSDLYHPHGLRDALQKFNFDAVACSVSGRDEVLKEIAAVDLPTAFFVYDDVARSYFGVTNSMKRRIFSAESDFICNGLQQELGVQTEKIRPVMEPDRYRTEARGGSVLVINPHPQKGGALTAEIARRMPHRQFLVVGGWQHTTKQSAVLAVERALTALPNVVREGYADDIRPIFAQSRLLLMPSIFQEPFGRTAAEALIAGLPVVSSCRGGLPETVGKGGVVLDPESDPDLWCTEIDRMFDDQAHYERLCAGARETASEPDRQPDFVRSRIAGIIERLVGQRSATA